MIKEPDEMMRESLDAVEEIMDAEIDAADGATEAKIMKHVLVFGGAFLLSVTTSLRRMSYRD